VYSPGNDRFTGCTGLGCVPLNSAHDFLFDNVEIRNYARSGVLGFYRTVFRNSEIHHNGSEYFDHGIYTCHHMTVDASLFHHNGGLGIQFHANEDQPGDFCTNGSVTNSLFYNNGSAAIVSDGAAPELLYNNVSFNDGIVYTFGVSMGGNRAPGSKGFQINYVNGSLVANNTSYNVDVCIQDGPHATNNRYINNLCVNSNLDFNNTGDWAIGNFGSTYTTNVFTNAGGVFVNPIGAHNFQLASGTGPATNTGTNLSSSFTTDANGTSRPQGSAWDVGACEWFSGAGPCNP